MSHEGFNTSELAKRYASALFSLAEENGALDAVATDLEATLKLLQESDDLRKMIASPLISKDEQTKAMLEVLKASGAHDLVQNFFGVVAQKRRLFASESIIHTFLELVSAYRGIKTAQVVSAKKLTATQLKNLEETFHQSLNATVNIIQEVDPSLIGGMIVKFGSRMVDSSVKTKLSKLEQEMKGLA